MTSIKLEAGSTETVMTTELNGFASDTRVISSNIDNSSGLYLVDDLELLVASTGLGLLSEPGGPFIIHVYLIRTRLSASGFEDGGVTVQPALHNHVGTFMLQNSSQEQDVIIRQIPIPPSQFKYLLHNDSNNNLASSGNILSRKPYRYQF